MENRTWVSIRGFSNYSISDHGEIHNNKTHESMRPSINNHGTLKISLISDEGKRQTRSVAFMVAQEFVDPPNPLSTQVILLNGDSTDVRAVNLAWRPPWFAWQYTRQLKRQVPAYYKILPVVNVTYDIKYRSIIEAATTEGLLFDDVWKSTYSGSMPYPSDSVFEVIDRV